MKLADVVYVPFVDLVDVIEGAFSDGTRNKSTSRLVVNVDCNLTAMVVFALIGKHLNETAFTIERAKRGCNMVNFTEKGANAMWQVKPSWRSTNSLRNLL